VPEGQSDQQCLYAKPAGLAHPGNRGRAGMNLP
jgi:hypothetical protein